MNNNKLPKKLIIPVLLISVISACGGGGGEDGGSDPKPAPTPINHASSGGVVISGTPEQGQQLLTSHTLADVDGTIQIKSYQWLANGTAISGATSATFTLSSAEVNSKISVTITYNDSVFADESITSAQTSAVTGTIPTNTDTTGGIVILGTPEQGQNLSITSSLADVDGTIQITGYQWFANSAAISGATNDTLTLSQAEVDSKISVTVTYNDSVFPDENVTSNDTTVVTDINDATTGEASITGQAEVGASLAINNALVDIDGVISVTAYRWFADAVEIAGQTQSTLLLTSTQLGTVITAQLTYSDSSYDNQTYTTAATTTVIDPSTLADKYWLEAECAALGDDWLIKYAFSEDPASNSQYIVVPNGVGNDTTEDSSKPASTFAVFEPRVSAGSYHVFVRYIAPGNSSQNDSFLIRVNGSSFSRKVPTETDVWQWYDAGIYSFTEGVNTVNVALREDGFLVDKIYIGATLPTDLGQGDNDCQTGDAVDVIETTADTTAVNLDVSNAIHVSNSGNDTSGDGSETSPYRTIKKAASLVTAGDLVLVSGGTYSEKDILPVTSGQEGDYITFLAKPGTGAVNISHSATDVSDTAPLFNLISRNYIWIEGFQFKDSHFGLASIMIQDPSQDSGTTTGTHNVVVNNRFINVGSTENGPAWNDSSQIGVFNGADNVICNNYFFQVAGDGITLWGKQTSNNLVCNNTFKAFFTKTGGVSRAIDVQYHQNSDEVDGIGNNVIAFNHAQDIVKNIWLDRNGSNNVIIRNFAKNGETHIFNESRCKHTLVQENIAVSMNTGYFSSYYTSTGWTEDARYVNNIAYDNAIGFKIHKSMRDEFRNNIAFNNHQYNLQFTDEALSHTPFIFRHNLWFSSSIANSIYLGGIPNPTVDGEATYDGVATSVTSFQAQVGETGGLSQEPLFADTDHFTLSPTSPAIDAGDNGLDIGAYATYPYSQTGWDKDYTTSIIKAYFDQSITNIVRGNSTTLTLRLNQASAVDVTLNISAIAGDALATEDYTLSTEQVIFTAGETIKTITVDTSGSFSFDEVVMLSLTNADNAVSSGRNLHLLRINAQ